MATLSLQNPVFATYVIAATLMILKVVSMSWLTVVRMMQVKGGFRSPEDLRKTPFNPVPNPKQLEPNDYVDRIRRIQLNDLENVPFFLVAAFLYVLTEPSPLLARLLLYGYVVSRLLHFAAYFTAQTHETRDVLDRWLLDHHLHGCADAGCRFGILTKNICQPMPVCTGATRQGRLCEGPRRGARNRPDS